MFADLFILLLSFNVHAVSSHSELSVYCLGTQTTDELKIFSAGSDFSDFELNGKKLSIVKVERIGESATAYTLLNQSKKIQFIFEPSLYFTSQLKHENSQSELRCKYVGKINSVQKPLCNN